MTTSDRPTERAAPAVRMTRREKAVLAVLSGAIFLEGIDVSMMGVALPAIRDELGMSTPSLQWVVSAYVLGYGGFVLLGGRAADLLGRRRMFLAWLAVFVVFSGLGGLATEGWMLIVARFVTGVSAGFMAPAGLSIITTGIAEGPARNKALLVYTGLAAGGFVLGLVAGGLLTAIDWRWVFFAPLVVAAVILAAAVRLVPRDTPPPSARGDFDLAGSLAVTGAMLALVLAVVRAPDVALPWTAATVAAGGGLLAAFVAIERRTPTPLVRLGLLRSAPLVRANVGALLFVGAFVAFQFVAVLYLQELRGWSPLETGLALLIVGIDAILTPTLTPRLIERFGTGPVIVAGMGLAAVGYALFLPLGAEWSYMAMLPTLLLVGLAFSLAFGALTIAATDGVGPSEQGLASGLLNVSFQFGAAIGLAVATAVYVGAAGGDGVSLDGYRSALFVPLAAVLLGLAVTATGVLPPRRMVARGRAPAADGAPA